MRLPLHVSVHIYDQLQGARKQYFVQLLSWIPLMYVHCVFVQYAAICHYRWFVCVSGAPVWVRSGHKIIDSIHRFYDQISPRQELQTHIQTDGNDVRPHTAQTQTHNERTSTESNLVTVQSTAYEPPEDGRKYGLKHVGATSLKCF